MGTLLDSGYVGDTLAMVRGRAPSGGKGAAGARFPRGVGWNCRQVPGRHEVWLYFADDVPSERLDAIQRALERGLARERPAGS